MGIDDATRERGAKQEQTLFDEKEGRQDLIRLLLTIEMSRTKRESPDLEDEFYEATAGSKRPQVPVELFPRGNLFLTLSVAIQGPAD